LRAKVTVPCPRERLFISNFHDNDTSAIGSSQVMSLINASFRSSRLRDAAATWQLRDIGWPVAKENANQSDYSAHRRVQKKITIFPPP